MLISFIFLGCTNSTNNQKNCATKVVLFWKDTPINTRKSILSEAFSINVHKDIQKKGLKNIPIEELGTLKNYEWIYFIYHDKNKCKEKEKYTILSLIKYLNVVKNAPKYSIINQISNKELNIVKNQNNYNVEKELTKWLDKETEKQLSILKIK